MFVVTTEAVKQRARQLGFDLCGIAPAGAFPELRLLRQWIDRGYAGTMGYLPRTAERRGPSGWRPGENWWRHAVGLIAVIWALFPVAYVISAAFNADSTLGGASLFPRAFTLRSTVATFGCLCATTVATIWQ